jgi:hypothetical protein
MVVAPLSYWFWWLWQLFKFTRREQFPRARKFWWIFVPFYGLYILYKQFDDIKAKAKASGHPFNSVLAGWLAFIGLYSSSGSSRAPSWVVLLSVMVGGAALAGAAFLVQRGANAYVRATYPTEQPRSMTAGEIVAAVLGIVLLALFIAAAFWPGS